MATIDTMERPAIVLRGRRLEYFTVVWNTLEGLVAVVAGIVAGSISLVGFGIDSFIEVTSGSVLLWRMSVDSDVHGREANETRALRIAFSCSLCTSHTIRFQTCGRSERQNTALRESFWRARLWLSCQYSRVPSEMWAVNWAVPACTQTQNKRNFALTCRHPPGRVAAQRVLRTVVGRPACGSDHGSYHRQRGH